MFGEEEIVKSHKPRSDRILQAILISFTLLLMRLWYLQIVKGDQFYEFSLNNKIRKESVDAPRGMMFTRNSKLLVNNVPRFDAVIIPQYISDKNEVISKLATILDMPEKDIKKRISRYRGQASYRSITIKKNISQKELSIIETESEKIPGVRVKVYISREYSGREIGAHLLGYISEISQQQLPRFSRRDRRNYKLGDFIGQSGLEEKFDSTLRGIDGREIVEVDARGRLRRVIKDNTLYEDIKNLPAIPGNNIRLTIDLDLQKAGYAALEGKVGSAVAIDVTNGEILAMVSRPSFDPSKFSRKLTQKYWNSILENEHNPMRDRTIQEHYAPGSTFKTISALAALEEKVIDSETEFECNGSLKVGRRTFHCWKKSGHGKVDVVGALRESCDVFFYQIAKKMDVDDLAKYAKSFGVGAKTGISLPREVSGLMPTKEWKKKRYGRSWQKGETLATIIGQSYVLMTPLQIANAYAMIANGGKSYKPTLIKEVFSINGDVIEKREPTLLKEIEITDNYLEIIKKGLFEVVNTRKGTAWWYKLPDGAISGKTGTSQVIEFSADKIYHKCEDREYKYRHHGIFASYAPSVNPRIAVAVVVEHGCHGSSAAAPVAKAIIKKYLEKYPVVNLVERRKDD